MNTAVWVLIVVTRVSAGTTVAMHDYNGRAACERAGEAVRMMSDDAHRIYSDAHTWCVPKGEQPR